MPQERTKLIGALKVYALISHLRGRIHGSKRKREIFFIESLGSGGEMKSKQVWVGYNMYNYPYHSTTAESILEQMAKRRKNCLMLMVERFIHSMRIPL